MEADGAGGLPPRGRGLPGESRRREALDGGPPHRHRRGARLEGVIVSGTGVVVRLVTQRLHLGVQRAADGREHAAAQQAAGREAPEHLPLQQAENSIT